jgi:hypothetical protein
MAFIEAVPSGAQQHLFETARVVLIRPGYDGQPRHLRRANLLLTEGAWRISAQPSTEPHGKDLQRI